jgi:hypothetical protein
MWSMACAPSRCISGRRWDDVTQDHFAMCFSRAVRRRPGPELDRHGDGKAPVCAPKAHEIGPLQVAPALMCGGSERVTKHQPPYSHWTRPKEAQPAPRRHRNAGIWCRQVSARRAKRRPRTDSLTPVPRANAAVSMGCYCRSLCPSVLKHFVPPVGRSVPSETPNPSSDTAQLMMETVTNETKRLELVT